MNLTLENPISQPHCWLQQSLFFSAADFFWSPKRSRVTWRPTSLPCGIAGCKISNIDAAHAQKKSLCTHFSLGLDMDGTLWNVWICSFNPTPRCAMPRSWWLSFRASSQPSPVARWTVTRTDWNHWDPAASAPGTSGSSSSPSSEESYSES